MFKRIDHIELLTAAPERAVAFYTGVLGFRERERLRIPQTPQGPLDLVYLELGNTMLEVMCFPEAKSRIPERAAEVRQVFPLAKGFVAGCLVTEGKINRNASARLRRGREIVHEGKIATLKRFGFYSTSSDLGVILFKAGGFLAAVGLMILTWAIVVRATLGSFEK